MLSLTVNGNSVQVDAAPEMPLLWVLRDLLGLTGTKFGCGMALCGACTVHLDGQPIRACVTPLRAVIGRRVDTIEGLDHWGRGNVPGFQNPREVFPRLLESEIGSQELHSPGVLPHRVRRPDCELANVIQS